MADFVRTATLDLAFTRHGPDTGEAVVLMHGFPYDPGSYDAMVGPLVQAGCSVVVPWLRGYGPTRFLSADTPRSGQQAALAHDLRDLLDALAIRRASLVGYDWGGRAACIVAALWPERVRCLVTGDGYNIQDIAGSVEPASAEAERRYWYQYYFHTQRGRDGLQANRRDIARLLWQLWSPGWAFTDAQFERSAAAFDNPDFVDVVIHSYRHRFGYAEGDPAFAATETLLAAQPAIAVPTIGLCGADDGVSRPEAVDPDTDCFIGRYERRLLPGIGHNIPQEAPAATLAALFDLWAAGGEKVA